MRAKPEAADSRTAGPRLGRLALVLVIASLCLGGTCSPGPPAIRLLTPANGIFTTDSSVLVTGVVENVKRSSIVDVSVNGSSVLPLALDNTFEISLPLPASGSGTIFHPIVATLSSSGGAILRDRTTVILGDSVADGDYSPQGVALRVNESGLHEMEPVVGSLVDIDLAALLPPGTLILYNYCYQGSFFGCLGRINVWIYPLPPPSISGFSIDIDPQTDWVQGDLTLDNLFVRARVDGVSGLPFTCYIDIFSAVTRVYGDYELEPDPTLPSAIDVSQLGGANVVFGGFSDSTDCNGFLGFFVETLISFFIGNVQSRVEPAIEIFLNTPDAQGDTPIAGAIEDALMGIELAGPIGEAIGVSLDTPLFSVDEDVGGITFENDARVLAALPDPDAVDLEASYHVAEVFPTFGATAPSGLPYDMAICISTSAFNQLLKAEVESGLLRLTITEFDFGQGPTPITAGLLATLVPEFAFLPPTAPLRFEIRPTLAPIVTGAPGPKGELASVEVGHLLISVLAVAVDEPFLAVAVDVEVGLEFGFAAGELSMGLGSLGPGQVQHTILINRMGTSESTLNVLTPLLLRLALPQLSDSLGTFPLPDFVGLELELVELDRNGEYLSLFLDLVAP